MKKLFIYFRVGFIPVLIFVSFVLSGCSQDPTQEESAIDSKATMTDEQLLEYMGYDLSEVIEYEDYYSIAGETVSKQRLEELRNDPQTRVPYKLDQTLDKEHQKIILILSGQYESQIREAAEEWNKLYNEKQSNIQFEFGNSGKYAVEFITNSPSSLSDLSIVVDKPYKGINATRITLNLDFDLWLNLSTTQIKYLYMHAFGHLVGFAHALESGLPPSGYWGAGDQWDPSSIMMDESNLLKNNNFYTGFSTSDMNAIRTVYPYITPPPAAPTFTISCFPQGSGSEQQNLNANTEYEFTAKYVYTPCPSPSYQFTVTKAGRAYPYTNLGNGKIKVKFTETGIYTVTAKVTNSTVQPNTETKTYTVITPRPIVEGPTTVELGKFYDFKITYWNPSYPNIAFNLSWVETLLKTGHATVQKVSNTLFRIRFEEPGVFRIFADISNGPSNQEEVYNVEVYYKAPYFKIEKIEGVIDSAPGQIPNQPSITPSLSNVVATYDNYIRFYADAACTLPLQLERSVVFNLLLDYEVMPAGISGVGVENSNVQTIIPKGTADAVLPKTQKFKFIKRLNNGVRPSFVNVFFDPFYTISYPENVGRAIGQ